MFEQLLFLQSVCVNIYLILVWLTMMTQTVFCTYLKIIHVMHMFYRLLNHYLSVCIILVIKRCNSSKWKLLSWNLILRTFNGTLLDVSSCLILSLQHNCITLHVLVDSCINVRLQLAVDSISSLKGTVSCLHMLSKK